MTGGRLKRVLPLRRRRGLLLHLRRRRRRHRHPALIAFHRAQGRLATVTAVQPPGRFGALEFDGATRVTGFEEKPRGDGAWINGGFFVLSPDGCRLHRRRRRRSGSASRCERLAAEGQLAAYRHDGFWQPMDTLRDRHLLEQLWSSGQAPWRKW